MYLCTLSIECYIGIIIYTWLSKKVETIIPYSSIYIYIYIKIEKYKYLHMLLVIKKSLILDSDRSGECIGFTVWSEWQSMMHWSKLPMILSRPLWTTMWSFYFMSDITFWTSKNT